MLRPVLTLRQTPETATVKEAKEVARAVAGAPEPAVVAFAMRLIADRDTWFNTLRRRQ